MVVTTLLLDTHAYVWALTAPDRLSSRARESIEEPTNTLVVSAASAWEMAIKHRAGTWPEADLLLRQHDDLVDRLGADHLEITAQAAIRAGSLEWAHADPFDRVLAAQGLVTHAVLVTRARAFADMAGLQTLW